MRRLADVVVRWSWAVIGVWVALAIALPLSFPSLGEMAEKHPLVILPSDAPSSVNATKMAEAFQEAGSDNLLVVAFINETGLKPADEVVYRKVVGELRHDITDVVAVQDFLSTPQLRKFLTVAFGIPNCGRGLFGDSSGHDSLGCCGAATAQSF